MDGKDADDDVVAAPNERNGEEVDDPIQNNWIYLTANYLLFIPYCLHRRIVSQRGGGGGGKRKSRESGEGEW